MSKHTPGPWRVIPQGPSHPTTWVGGNETPGRGPTKICDFFPDTEERLANAHLIAAAPDLLKALKIALQVGVARLCEVEQIDEIERAIAKAEGRDE